MERFRMLKAKRKRLREEQESMDGVGIKLEDMNCSPQVPHPTKRACAGNARILKEVDHISVNTRIPTAEVSKLDPPAVKRPPARYVDIGAAELTSNASGGFGQEGQDDKEEEIARRVYRDEGDGITGEAKDGLLNDDKVNGQEKTVSNLEVGRQKRPPKSFEDRIEDLEAFKEKHGHVLVTEKHDKSLARFCINMRAARRGTNTGRTVINEVRINALDELGFAWDKKNSFEERIEEMQAFKEKHGHVRVTGKHDKRLHDFCVNMRYARRNPGTGMTITEDRINALDELGFEWGGKTLGFAGGKKKSFEERVEELKAFKEKHGHVRVTVKHDKSLARFCINTRAARRGKGSRKVPAQDRIKALDEMGFEWAPQEIK